MAAIAKEQRYELEKTVYEHRADGGVVAVRAWLYDRQKEINARWLVALTADELYRMQGAAQEVSRLIKLIENGPAIREGAKHA